MTAVIAGLAALKGPKHGGAGVLASQLVKTLVDRDVEPMVRERVALGERFPGFGHGVYKRGDPRARFAAERAGARRRAAQIHPGSPGADRGSDRRIRQYRLCARRAGARAAHAAGSELALFAMARSVGWIAHASEQLQFGKLISPRARYVGPAPGRRLSSSEKPRPRAISRRAAPSRLATEADTGDLARGLPRRRRSAGGDSTRCHGRQ